jgi:hypothetical protein
MRSSILVVGLIGLFLVGVFEAKAADLEAKLDSKDGTISFSIKDLDNVEVARINSVGNIQADGTLSVDGTGNSYLMGNLGIGDGSPASLLTVGSGDLFQINSSGNLVKLNNVTYSWPSTQGGASTVLTNSDGAGTLTWATPAGGDVTGPAASIDNEISLFSGTTGKVIKRATTSGIVKATSGVISAAEAGTDYVAPNAAITGATNTKITYDTKGLVTAGATAVLASADFANQGTTTTVLHGNAAGNPSFGAVVEADITLADNTTNDVSTTNHGFAPKAPNNTTLFLRGDGTWAGTPATGIGYSINVQALTSSPTDGATVYFGMLPKVPQTTAARSKVYIRKAGTIKVAEIYCYSGTAGSNESWSLYVGLNNTTDYLIATLAVATSERVFTNAALSIAVVAGDYIEIKGIQPTWASNPFTTIYGGYVYIE